MRSAIFTEMKDRMSRAIEALVHEFATLRTGRASIAILDGVKVDYYGSLTPLNQLASLSVPEPQTILIQPWDLTQIQAIEKAVMGSDLGLTPSNDGKVIRLNIPQLTEQRRKELVKVARKYGEEARVSIRNSRRDANDRARALERDKEIGQDELKKFSEEIQKITDEYVGKVDRLLAEKEEEIMEV
ncbi:MAG: ribosome recycling factor [Thermodesulfobacteriota bacterium]